MGFTVQPIWQHKIAYAEMSIFFLPFFSDPYFIYNFFRLNFKLEYT